MHHAALADTPPTTVYRIARLRTDVFVHEQRIVDEEELDGRDLEPATTLWWVEEDGEVVSTLRVLGGGSPPHIGRVATAKTARGRGLAAQLLVAALAEIADTVEISAQAYLETWYTRFGFVRTGPSYLEAGIDHVPMVHAHP